MQTKCEGKLGNSNQTSQQKEDLLVTSKVSVYVSKTTKVWLQYQGPWLKTLFASLVELKEKEKEPMERLHTSEIEMPALV